MHKIEEHILTNWTDVHGARIYIAVSGGLDSIALAFALKKLNFAVEVLHVNYQLRADASEKDALFVEKFCQQFAMPFHKKVINLRAQLNSGGNLQALARSVRYDWFNYFLLKNEGSFVALGHHKNDQVETFFLNLARKSGVIGLASMLERNDQFIRPFLPFSKEEIKEYAQLNKMEWREDTSNISNKYRRNFLRNAILPILNHHIPSLEESVLILVEQFQQKQRDLEQNIRPIMKSVELNQTMDGSIYEKLDDFQRIELMRQLNQPVAKVEELNRLCHLKNGKKIMLSENSFDFISIVKQNDCLYFLKKERKNLNKKLTIEEVRILPKNFTKNAIFLDSDKIKGELLLRRWQIGDRMKPIGMQGSKLISDIIKDTGLTPLQKQEVLVVTDVEEIHWCVGLCVGRVAVSIKDENARIIKVTFSS
tara:strand:+ start:20657 stop:21925 length:1269 start_codon:yes stop_codon:yes gene_type:complete